MTSMVSVISQNLSRMGGCGGRGRGAGGRRNSALGGRFPQSASLGRSPSMSLMPWFDPLMCPVCRLVHGEWAPAGGADSLQCQPNPSPWILLKDPGFCSNLYYESSFLTVIHLQNSCLRRYGLACGARVHLWLAAQGFQSNRPTWKPRIRFGFALQKLVLGSNSAQLSTKLMPAALWFGLRHQGPFVASSRINPPGNP